MCAILFSTDIPILTAAPHAAIAIYKPQDVRPILTTYQGKDIPIEYAKHEAAAKQKHIEEWQNSRKSLASSGFTFSGLFGGSKVRRSLFVP